MTEQEALTKWCPFARFAMSWEEGNNFLAFNVNRARDNGDNRCLGSGCMAWRVGTDAKGKKFGFCGIAGSVGAKAGAS